MQHEKFYRWGQCVYKARWMVLIGWLVLIVACLPYLAQLMVPFKSSGFSNDNSKAAQTKSQLTKQLGYNDYNKILVLYHNQQVSRLTLMAQIKDSLKNLKALDETYEIILPEKSQFSEDKHTAYAVIIIKDKQLVSNQSISRLRSQILPVDGLTIQLGGEPIFEHDLSKQTQVDLYKSEYIATPVSILALILIFGTLIACLIPVVLGLSSALFILTSLYFLAHHWALSVFTINIALLLGLCLSLDYALFIIYRFRKELIVQETVAQALAVTIATAGKAIFFSALAVLASISALLIFPVNILFSVGIGGITAVTVALIVAIIILPALLAITGPRINQWAIHWQPSTRPFYFWRRLASLVVARPLLFFLATLSLLLFLSYPFLSTQLGISDYRILPKDSTSRNFIETYAQKFNQHDLNPILIQVQTKERLFTKGNLTKIYNLTQKLKKNPLIYKVQGIMTLNKDFDSNDYQKLYRANKTNLPFAVKQNLKLTTTAHSTLITVYSMHENHSPSMKKLINQLEKLSNYQGLKISLTGKAIADQEVISTIKAYLPYALLLIGVTTYLILLILLHSLFLPFKAILMNLLSLAASYGVLVFIIQQGHFHQWLGFEPQHSLDISLLVIIFCALFGFSMDYEIFLLTRIREAYQKNNNTSQSIIFGIEQSSKIITSAAAIVICICGSFMVADVVLVKAFGLGIAVAIFIDAFLIRTFLVPATMMLVDTVNWYIPLFLKRWLVKLD